MIKDIIKISFIQLLIVYTILVLIASLNLFTKFTLHLEILAIILGIFAFISINKEKDIKINKMFIFFSLAFILILRLLPYLHNSIPLGYDSGLYNYIMQNPSVHDMWVVRGFEPGLFMITSMLKFVFSINTILTYGLVFLELLLGVSIYYTTKKFFNENIAILALILYAISSTQFIAFTYNYYKQILGLILLLWSLCLLKSTEDGKKSKYGLLILCAAFLGAVHRPTFLIFGFIFIAKIVRDYFINKKLSFQNIGIGFVIVVLTLLSYIGRIKDIILPYLIPIVTKGIWPGTFFDLATYRILSLAYLPFALLGFIFLAKKKKFNLLWMFLLINAVVVVFRLIFADRYIISLDIAMIIFAAYGLYLILQHNKLGILVAILLIVSSGYIAFAYANNAKPLIDQNELNIIKSLNSTEPNSVIMSTDGYYSPWLLYSNRKVIAPGMFDYDIWTEPEWKMFWNNTNTSELMSRYQKPVYVFVGKNQYINNDIFNTSCFSNTINESETRVYKWIC